MAHVKALGKLFDLMCRGPMGLFGWPSRPHTICGDTREPVCHLLFVVRHVGPHVASRAQGPVATKHITLTIIITITITTTITITITITKL